MNKNYAPIALFVYNRPWHTQQTIEALLKNELASESDLVIFCDGPKNDSGRDKTDAVRKYVNSICGFKNIEIHTQNQNRGLANSIITGVTEVVNRYGTIIVLEDDMITSPYFLRYINDALLMYQEEEKVISIHGYTFPVKGELPETFFLRGANCWGWATWKRGWDVFEADGQKLYDSFSKNLINEFDLDNSFPHYKMLKDQITGKIDSWAIRWHASAFINEKLTLWPGKSLVNNIGMDNSGTHCAQQQGYNVELSRHPVSVKCIDIVESDYAKHLLSEYYKTIKIPFFKKCLYKIIYLYKQLCSKN